MSDTYATPPPPPPPIPQAPIRFRKDAVPPPVMTREVPVSNFVAMDQSNGNRKEGDERLDKNDTDSNGKLERLPLPKPEVMFRLDSEATFESRLNQKRREEANKDVASIRFPAQSDLGGEAYVPRAFPPARLLIEPHYVCYRRLYFEEKNAERYGWSMGPIQPLLSSAVFFMDLSSMPYKAGSFPFQQWDSSACWPLPGSPEPLRLYPPGLSATGGLLQIGTTVAMYAIFP